MWLNGQTVLGEGEHPNPVVDPYSNDQLYRALPATDEQVETAVALAVQAFGHLQGISRGVRAEWLLAASLALENPEWRGRFTDAIVREAGKPMRLARIEIERAAATFRSSAELLRHGLGETGQPIDLTEQQRGYRAEVRRIGIGPVLAISPFNFPLNLVAHKVAPALAAGNPVVLKPAPQTPRCALLLAELLTSVGVPDGALSVVYCSNDQAGKLVADERFKLLTFTGSADVGWKLKPLAGKKRVVLELGGNAPAIIAASANIPLAASKLALSAYGAAGQVCIKTQRLIVAEPVYDQFVNAFLTETEQLFVGDPFEEATVVGPLVNDAAAARLRLWLNDAISAGAQVLCGGPPRGRLMPPTLLAGVPPRARLACEEAFGPVAVIEPYETLEAAIAAANDSRYGLQAAIFTDSIAEAELAATQLEFGGVMINEAPSFRMDHLPYGGEKDSGFGREGAVAAYLHNTTERLIVRAPSS